MTARTVKIRRRSNGSIDVDFYRGRALMLRHEARCDLMRGAGGFGWAAAVAMVVLLAVAVLAPRRHANLAGIDRAVSATALITH